MNSLDILRDGLAAECHGAIHLRQDLRSGAPAEIPAEIRRNLKHQRDVIRLQPLQGFIGGANRRSRSKVNVRAGKLLEISAAFRRLVEIERSIANVFDIGGNSKTEDKHQQCRTNEGKGQSHRVAKYLHCFIVGVCQHPAKAQLQDRKAF